MPNFRPFALAAAGVLLLVHGAVLVFQYGTQTASFWGDVIGAAFAPLLASVVIWVISRQSQDFDRRVWRLVSLSLLIASIGGVFYTYFFDYVKSSAPTWPSDILVFFWPVPAMLTLFLSPT